MGLVNPDLRRRVAKNSILAMPLFFGWYLKAYQDALTCCKNLNIITAARGDYQIDHNQSLFKKIIKRIYYPFFLNKFDFFLANGIRSTAYLRHYFIPAKKIIFAPYAIDQNFWKSDSQKSGDDLNFLWVGKFVKKKYPLELIRAFKNAFNDKENVCLNMVGAGELFAAAESLCSGSSNIKLLGFKNQTELKEIYAQSDCFVLVSDYEETWGLVVNEAFSFGIPAIVSTACGCFPDLIEEDTGLGFELNNQEELTSQLLKMRMFLSDEKKVEKFKKGIKAKNKKYSFEMIIKACNTFLDK